MQYKGFQIDVEKINKDGWSIFVYRILDELVLIDKWNPCIKTKEEAIEECQITIDDFIKNPKKYE